jgi:hypothetical protein
MIKRKVLKFTYLGTISYRNEVHVGFAEFSVSLILSLFNNIFQLHHLCRSDFDDESE